MNMNTLLNEDIEGYSWEGDYEQTWKSIQEDETGTLRSGTDDLSYRSRKRQMLEKQSNIRLSMMRHMFVVIDNSACMSEKDIKPSRYLCVLKFLEKFVHSYFDQNPISQLGLIITRNKIAEKICDLVGNPKKITDKLSGLKEKLCQGEPSIQNSLELSLATLKNVKSHSSREVLIVMGSLTTCDPSDIYETIKECKKFNIRCSIIGLAAEVHICKKICQELEGIYAIILDELHLLDLFQKVAFPLPNSDTGAQTLMRMGFPQHKICSPDEPSMCMCHLASNETRFSTGGYFCPICDNKYCELPVECGVCGLTLVMAPHLARSYHHLFPLDSYKEIQNEKSDQSHVVYENCYGCQQPLNSEKTAFQCDSCKNVYCIECDIFIHETLHSCPSCTNTLSN
jgi:transcription initiation factor TFIIH subunit 2